MPIWTNEKITNNETTMSDFREYHQLGVAIALMSNIEQLLLILLGKMKPRVKKTGLSFSLFHINCNNYS